MHDPAHYLTPDVDADMTTLHMEEIGPDQVRVTGASGHPAPATLKIVAGYEDGFMGQAVIGYAWPDALAKAQLAAQIITQQMAERGLKAEETVIEYQGYNSIHGPLADPTHVADLNEVYLLLDFISGRSDASLDGLADVPVPAQDLAGKTVTEKRSAVMAKLAFGDGSRNQQLNVTVWGRVFVPGASFCDDDEL